MVRAGIDDVQETAADRHVPSADDYAAEQARYAALALIDLRAHQAGIRDAYRNEVLSNVDDHCMRLSVFDGEYRWHRHPGSNELFLVVEGRLQASSPTATSSNLGLGSASSCLPAPCIAPAPSAAPCLAVVSARPPPHRLHATECSSVRRR